MNRAGLEDIVGIADQASGLCGVIAVLADPSNAAGPVSRHDRVQSLLEHGTQPLFPNRG